MWFIPLIKTTASLIVSGVIIEKILDYTNGDEEFNANPEVSGDAVAIYQRSWFDKNMMLLAGCGLFCAWLIFGKKK